VNNFEYYAPDSLQEALASLEKFGQKARILAGGTDLIAQMKAGRVQPSIIIDVKKIAELNRLELSADNTIHIGAAVPLSKITAFPAVIQQFRILHQGCSLIGSDRIRNRGTMGGNICNAAPSADSAPALLCLGARAIIAQSKGNRIVPLQDFFQGPGRTVIAPDELLVEIEIPASPKFSAGSYLRHTPREEMDIAVAGVAVFLVLNPNSNKCQEARIALGAVAPIPVRVPQAEAILAGNILNKAVIEKAAEAAATAASPISDIRSSADYRRELVKVLTRRALENTCDALDIRI